MKDFCCLFYKMDFVCLEHAKENLSIRVGMAPNSRGQTRPRRESMKNKKGGSEFSECVTHSESEPVNHDKF